MKIPFPSVCFSNVFLTLKFETLVLFTIAIELSHFCLTFEDFCLGLTFSHGPHDPKRFGREEKWGLGTRQLDPHVLIMYHLFIIFVSLHLQSNLYEAVTLGEWLSDRLIQVARNTVQRIRSPVMIRSDVWPQIETFISGVLMVCENKQGNQLLYLMCYIIWNSMNK